ncbi:MAG: hypothetical protein HY719_04780 [Planctomycetes bacterium]|nr:hypothetical protein [Planctomycetota bacterium]
MVAVAGTGFGAWARALAGLKVAAPVAAAAVAAAVAGCGSDTVITVRLSPEVVEPYPDIRYVDPHLETRHLTNLTATFGDRFEATLGYPRYHNNSEYTLEPRRLDVAYDPPARAGEPYRLRIAFAGEVRYRLDAGAAERLAQEVAAEAERPVEFDGDPDDFVRSARFDGSVIGVTHELATAVARALPFARGERAVIEPR